MACDHGMPRFLEDRKGCQVSRHAEGELLHHAFGLGFSWQREAICREFQTVRHGSWRVGVQCGHLQANCQTANLHSRRVRDECRCEPPRSFSPRKIVARGFAEIWLSIETPHHCWFHYWYVTMYLTYLLCHSFFPLSFRLGNCLIH